jgi:integrase
MRKNLTLKAIDALQPAVAGGRYDVAAVMSKLCNWYMAREESYTTPIVRGMRRTKPRERARERAFTDDDLRLFWQVSAKLGAYGRFLRTALLTAQRRAKVCNMQWSHIDDCGTWTIPAEPREKTNAKSLSLSRLAIDVISSEPRHADCDYVFAGRGNVPINGFSKAKRQLDAAMTAANETPIAPWTVHDLRRTARSLMARARVRPDVSERVLGHAIQGVEGIYDRYSYNDEKAEALEKLAELIERIVT